MKSSRDKAICLASGSGCSKSFSRKVQRVGVAPPEDLHRVVLQGIVDDVEMDTAVVRIGLDSGSR